MPEPHGGTAKRAKIMIVEDDTSLALVLQETVELLGCASEVAASVELALPRLAAATFDILITDINLPGQSGLELLPQAFHLQPHLHAIVITAYGTIERAVEAMKRGAADFLTKPVSLATLKSALQVAVGRIAQAGVKRATSDIVCQTPVMRRLLEQVEQVAVYNSTILVTGETGTGKELIARALHRQSPRSKHPLVTFNCAAVPEQLLEDELFGHVKGAFTGAQGPREGRFERADKGTLFLDEIGDMSLPLQSKLLRVLQEREFEKIGSSRPVKIDVRVVAATSANLEKLMAEGKFRLDLYYRLNVIHLRIPPLRERLADVPVLAQHLLERFCDSAGLPAKTITGEALQALCAYHWPGNVRQLQNAMERAAAFTGVATLIGPTDLPEEARGNVPSFGGITPVLAESYRHNNNGEFPPEGLNLEAIVSNLERELLLQSLEKTGGNKMQAAKLLNMKRTTFIEKLKRLQIGTERDDEAGELIGH